MQGGLTIIILSCSSSVNERISKICQMQDETLQRKFVNVENWERMAMFIERPEPNWK